MPKSAFESAEFVRAERFAKSVQEANSEYETTVAKAGEVLDKKMESIIAACNEEALINVRVENERLAKIEEKVKKT